MSALELVRVRDCDGACCIESPRFPNADHSDCIYRNPLKPEHGCMLMDGSAEMPAGNCPVFDDMTAQEAFKETCVEWPHNSKAPREGQTAGCCWQFVKANNGNY